MTPAEVIDLLRTISPMVLGGLLLGVVLVLRRKLGKGTTVTVGGNRLVVGGEVPVEHHPASARAFTNRVVQLASRVQLNKRVGLLEAMMVAGEEGLAQYMAQIEQDAIDYAATLSKEESDIFMMENDIAKGRIEPELYQVIKNAMIDNNIPLKEDHEAFVKYVKMKSLTLDGAGMKERRKVVWHRHLHDRFLAFSRENDQKYVDILESMFDRAGRAERDVLEQVAKDKNELEQLTDTYCRTGKLNVDVCIDVESEGGLS